MRIVHLSTMNAFFGGEVHLAKLCEGLAHRGHEVSCVVRPDSELSRVLPSLGLQTHTLPLVDWFDPGSVKRLSALLRELKPNILHSHVPRDYFLAAVSTLGLPVANVGTRHQLRPFSHVFFKRPFLNRFAGFIAVSEAVRKGLEEVTAVQSDLLQVIHHGIEAPEPEVGGGPAGARLRLLCGAAIEDPLVGFVGKLCPTKGVSILLQAMARLEERWPRLKLVLVGQESTGSDFEQGLRQQVQALGLGERVVFAGYIPNAGRLSAAFDIQVVPSEAEPFGLVTLEAMAAAVPVVLTNSGGSPEIVRDGLEGFLVPPGDAEALARKLDCLLDSPGLRREMGQKGRDRVLSRFNPGLMLDGTEKMYRRALRLPEPAGNIASA